MSKHDVIMAGLGGMGVLAAGKILSRSSLEHYEHVSWLPSYGVEKRGGLCECSVIFSNHEISSPVIEQARTVVVFTGSQFEPFENRVKPQGLLLIDSTGFTHDQKNRPFDIIEIPSMTEALKMGDVRVSNLILLGAYIGMTEALPEEFLKKEIKNMLGAKKEVDERNQKAFQYGVTLGKAKKIIP